MKLRLLTVAVPLVGLAALGGGCKEQAKRTEQGVDGIAKADQLACQTDRNVVQQALDAYLMLNGEDAEATERILVEKQFLVEESEFVDIVEGTVVFAGACADD
jgi:hypothetical protein